MTTSPVNPGIEGASELGVNSQQREIRRRDDEQADARRRRRAREVVVVIPGRRDVLEDSRAREVLDLGIGHADVLGADARKVGLDADELLRPRIGQRVKQRRIDDAEDRGRGSDAERDRQNRDRGEARRLAQHPQRVARVLNEVVPREPAPRLVEPLLGRLPKARCAAARACSSLNPSSRRRSVSSSMWASISAPKSVGVRLRRNIV